MTNDTGASGPFDSSLPHRLRQAFASVGAAVTATSRARDLTLTEFLLARVAEDEFDAVHDYWAGDTKLWEKGRARVLAECEAKRRIVEREVNSQTNITYRREFVLRSLASVYADHPDYRDEWKP